MDIRDARRSFADEEEGHARTPLVIAHRGDSVGYPENTTIAFAVALAEKVDGIELDVRLSRDGVAVVCHDADLSRFGGTAHSLKAMTAEDIRVVDVGSWKDPRFSDARVPTLEQTLRQCRRTTLYVELKATGGRGRTAYHRQLIRAVVAAIAKRGAAKRVRILCFDGGVLSEVARVAPHLLRVRNCERLPKHLDRWLDDQPSLHAACFDRRILTKAVVDTCHAHAVQVFSWSANDAPAADRLRNMGVDAILSDRPGWLVRHLRK
jgi:glycerophosphoryl diester phosphodiesterase